MLYQKRTYGVELMAMFSDLAKQDFTLITTNCDLFYMENHLFNSQTTWKWRDVLASKISVMSQVTSDCQKMYNLSEERENSLFLFNTAQVTLKHSNVGTRKTHFLTIK